MHLLVRLVVGETSTFKLNLSLTLNSVDQGCSKTILLPENIATRDNELRLRTQVVVENESILGVPLESLIQPTR